MQVFGKQFIELHIPPKRNAFYAAELLLVAHKTCLPQSFTVTQCASRHEKKTTTTHTIDKQIKSAHRQTDKQRKRHTHTHVHWEW